MTLTRLQLWALPAAFLSRTPSQSEIDRVPVRLSMVEMRTIGSGGGSLAAVDASGRLTVGPRSAGAILGPVAYGRGGTEPTATDAHLVLGRLDSRYFFGGRMALDAPGAASAIESRVARPLSLATEQAAQGILRLTNAGLDAAIRLSLFKKAWTPVISYSCPLEGLQVCMRPR